MPILWVSLLVFPQALEVSPQPVPRHQLRPVARDQRRGHEQQDGGGEEGEALAFSGGHSGMISTRRRDEDLRQHLGGHDAELVITVTEVKAGAVCWLFT